MALKFLNKKGWHTGSLRNIENVWKAEQKHDAEQKKLEELRKQIHEERERSEFRQLQEAAGLVPRQERLDFLYESGLAVGKGSSEGFKALESQASGGVSSSAAESSSSKMASSGGGGGDAPRKKSITNIFRSKKTVTRSLTTPTATPPSTTPLTTTPSSVTPSTTTPYAHQIYNTSQYDGPLRSGYQQHIQNAESSTQMSRRYIEPDGHVFHPHGPPSHEISNIIKSNFSAPYVSWKKIPQEVRDMWFREFERSFHWLPEHNYSIRNNFERGGSKRLRDLFTDVREDGDKPEWLGDVVWAGLLKEWSDPAYVKKRAQNKQNRASDCGGMGTSLSTGGSVPHTEYRRRLEKELGRAPTMSELHTRTHQSQRTKDWIDERARLVNEEYLRLRELQSQASTGDGSSAASSQAPSDFNLWTQAVGGKKKGRTYGLGAQGPAFDAQGLYTSQHSGNYNMHDIFQQQQDLTSRIHELEARTQQQEMKQHEEEKKHREEMLAQQTKHQMEMTNLLKDLRRQMNPDHDVVPGALFEDKPQSANDAWRKLHSDPLLLIRQREQEALARIKNNPIRMAMIRNSVESEKKQHEDKEKHRKKKHKDKHHHNSKDDDLCKSQSGSEYSSELQGHKRRRNHEAVQRIEDEDKEDRRNEEKGGRRKINHVTEQHESSKEKHEKHSSTIRSDSKYFSEYEERRKGDDLKSDHHKPSKHGNNFAKSHSGIKYASKSEEEEKRKGGKASPELRNSYEKYSSKSYSSSKYASGSNEEKRKRDASTTKQHHTNSDLNLDTRNREIYSRNQQQDTGYNRRRGVPKMTEEERKARLQEMQMDAELHEEQRWKRLKNASEADDLEAKQATYSRGKNFLDATQKSVYGMEKGGSATIEESVRRRTHYSQGQSAHESNAFRR